MRKLTSLLLLFSLAFSSIAFAQSTPDPKIKRVEENLLPAVLIKGDPAWSIAERMKFYKVPGLSVAVIKDFHLEWAKGYGVKDLETNEPVTTDTMFQAGSISKSVNAMIAMKKVEQGKLSLDENINDKLTSWKLPDNEFTAKKKVTLKNLLSHTAGTTVHGFPGYAVDQKLPTLPQVLDGQKPANTAAVRVDFEPGSKYRYSGGGTTIAQLTLMDVEKRAYPDIARETVLDPLNMTNSTYSQPLPTDWREKAATGYKSNGREVEGKIHVYPEMAAAGLWTTPTDLAKFAVEMQLSLAGRSNKILSKSTVATMTTPVLDEAALGFFIDKRTGTTYFGHDGADEGFRAQMLLNKDKGYGAIAMVNSDNGQILNEVIRGIAKEYQWDDYLPAPYEITSVDAEKLAKYVGRFQVNADRVLTITSVAGSSKLNAQPTGETSFELLPISDTTFIRRDATLKYTFVPAETGESAALQIIARNGSAEAKRISSDTLIPFEMLMSGKTVDAIAAYRKIKQDRTTSIVVEEDRINNLGYGLMRQKKLEEAIALLKLNVEFYPTSWNVYDSLAEMYMTNGDKDLAIANYKKSLELNPGNTNGVEMLKKLEARPSQPD
ncbi:MAG TPA: serine hydrolase [Pyrinomonadaceae bacterium]|nr:serine hydrolase [Pyrinomonadaceae bacterium]